MHGYQTQRATSGNFAGSEDFVDYPFTMLTLSQTINFRLFHTEIVCRQQILNLMKMKKSSLMG